MRRLTPITLGQRQTPRLPPRERGELLALDRIRKSIADPEIELDAVLILIAAEIQTLTEAGGIAVAVSEGPGIVCRATSGDTLPDIGARVDVTSGITGECARAIQTVRCDDTENDSRVNAKGCPALGIRSMVAVPIVDQGNLAGILEAFSPEARAFGDEKVATLERMSRLIGSALVRPANKRSEPAPQPAPPPAPLASETEADDEREERETRDIYGQRPWLKYLVATVAAILAIALVWSARDAITSKPKATLASQGPDPGTAQSVGAQPNAQALISLAQAAGQGDPEAQFRLGSFYLGGEGTEQSYLEAAQWFSKAAEQGQVAAQSILGALYFSGRGVPRDYVTAYMWLSIAASAGSSTSKEQLDLLLPYMSREDIAEGKRRASEWLGKHGQQQAEDGAKPSKAAARRRFSSRHQRIP